MSEPIQKNPAVTTEDCQMLKEFFATGGLLSQACREVGLNHESVRRNINGPTKNMKLVYMVILKTWVTVWQDQEIERKKLSEMVSEI